MIANVLAYATTGPHRARAQSAVADGARNRNRTLRVHGMLDRARAREAPHRLPGTDLDPRCGASEASTVWRQVATPVWRQEARAEEPRCRNECQHASSWENQGSNL